MKICDRCLAPAVDEVIFTSTDEHFDVCETCRDEIKELLHSKTKKPSSVKLTEGKKISTTKGRKVNGRKGTSKTAGKN